MKIYYNKIYYNNIIMNSESIQYSLETPKYNFYGLGQDNILNSKILTMLKKNNNIYGGGTESSNFSNSNCIIMVIGILIIIVGFVLCWFKNDWNTTQATIQSFQCTNSQCKINIIYNVNQTSYTKTILLDNPNPPTESTIPIYYQESNPNIVRLYNFNYSIIGIILIVIGIFVFASSLCNISQLIPSNTSGNSSLYSGSRNVDGLDIVYTN